MTDLMRTGLLILLFFLLPFQVTASSVTIRTIQQGNKTSYIVQMGAFSTKEKATALKERLTRETEVKATVTYLTEKKLWVVKSQPIVNYEEARALQKAVRKVHQSNSSSPGKNENIQKKIWNLKNANIRAVIAEVSRVTGKNFIIDPRVQGKISIVSSTPISDKELYEVFLSMLQISGYAAIPSGDVIKIVPNIDAKTLAMNMDAPGYSKAEPDDMLVEVVPVKYVPADQLVPVLRPLMPQWSSVSAYSPSNMLILSGRMSNVKQLAEIIRQVDDSGSNGIDIVHLRHAMAMDVVNTLKDLIKSPTGPGRKQTAISADDRSNTILVSGSKTERIRLRMIIQSLDKKNASGLSGNTQVIYLNYLRAEDLVPILAGIAQANFSGNVGTTIGTITKPELDSTNPASSFANGSSSTDPFSSSSGNSRSNATGTTSNSSSNTSEVSNKSEGSSKPTVQIIAEPNTNSIILNAPPGLNGIIRSVISQLDIRPAQLLVEAIVAEVNERDANDLGIEWGSRTTTEDGQTTSFTPGLAILNSQTSIAQFEAQIHALATNRRANILSTPSVVVLDNQQAKILIGKQVSIQTTSYPNNAGGTTAGSPFETFDRVNVALHLYVRPQITRGDGIKLQIDQGNDTIDPGSEASTTNPVFNISSIVTSVHVDSGDIIILGGLAQDGIGNDDNRLPVLGDIPGIGRIFQRNKRTREKKVLMVFIKPIILRTEKDNIFVTGSKYNNTRITQLKDLRRQEVHIQDDKELYMAPLRSKNLPKPFTSAQAYPLEKKTQSPPKGTQSK